MTVQLIDVPINIGIGSESISVTFTVNPRISLEEGASPGQLTTQCLKALKPKLLSKIEALFTKEVDLVERTRQ